MGSQSEHAHTAAPPADFGLGHAMTSIAKKERSAETKGLVMNIPECT
jgi:hypothetical protein